eukprot:6180647-Pleurochrysis_carterae.AAC.2
MPVAQLEIPATANLLESLDPLVELADHLLAMGTVEARDLFAAVNNGNVHQFLEGGLQGVTRDKGPGAVAGVVVDFSLKGLLPFVGINISRMAYLKLAGSTIA